MLFYKTTKRSNREIQSNRAHIYPVRIRFDRRWRITYSGRWSLLSPGACTHSPRTAMLSSSCTGTGDICPTFSVCSRDATADVVPTIQRRPQETWKIRQILISGFHIYALLSSKACFFIVVIRRPISETRVFQMAQNTVWYKVDIAG